MWKSGDRAHSVKYVYDLPYTERKLLCNILDINNQWEKLGGQYMGFTVLQLNEMARVEKCGDSPTDRLLQVWGHKNNTVLRLYCHLYQMEHYQGMHVLLPFIPEKYHYMAGKTHWSDAREAFDVDILPKPPPELLTSQITHKKEYRPPEEKSYNRPNMLPILHPNSNNVNPADSEKNTTKVDHSKTKLPGDFLRPHSATNRCDHACANTHHASQTIGKIINMVRRCGEDGRSCEENETGNCLTQHNVTVSIADREKENKENAIGRKSSPSSHFPEEVSALRPCLQTPGSDKVVSVSQPSSSTSNRSPSTSSLASNISDVGVPSIPFDDLVVGTNNFCKSNLLGKGGFGQVYKGTWKNTRVAVKRLDQKGKSPSAGASSHITQCIDELRFLQSNRHDNILQVYGFSAEEGKSCCLIYQFMPNGSLQDRLRLKGPSLAYSGGSWQGNTNAALAWYQRLLIAKGTAGALQFLHTVREKPLIHGDVKSANILLDKNFEPKLGDFGLAREGPGSKYTSVEVSSVKGTLAYIPEEYLRDKKLSVKVDTFSFGVVMFELCSGKKAHEYDGKTETYLRKTFKQSTDKDSLRDKNAGVDYANFFGRLSQIGEKCVHELPSMRPAMKEIDNELDEFLGYVQDLYRTRLSIGDPPSSSLYVSTLGTPAELSTSPSNHPSNPIQFIQVSPPVRPLILAKPQSYRGNLVVGKHTAQHPSFGSMLGQTTLSGGGPAPRYLQGATAASHQPPFLCQPVGHIALSHTHQRMQRQNLLPNNVSKNGLVGSPGNGRRQQDVPHHPPTNVTGGHLSQRYSPSAAVHLDAIEKEAEGYSWSHSSSQSWKPVIPDLEMLMRKNLSIIKDDGESGTMEEDSTSHKCDHSSDDSSFVVVPTSEPQLISAQGKKTFLDDI